MFLYIMSLPFLIPQFIQSYFELKNHAMTQGKKKALRIIEFFQVLSPRALACSPLV